MVEEIPIDEEWLKTLYDILIEFYHNTDRPIISGFPIVFDYDESMLSACVERPKTVIGGKAIYPHILQRAAVLMQAIILFHPFVDGNKRSALLATNFYLHWNGYRFVIPNDADEFTKDVAQNKYSLNDILNWLVKNTQRTPSTVIRHWLCIGQATTTHLSEIPLSERAQRLTKTFLFPLDAISFFAEKVLQEKRQRKGTS